MSQRPYSPRRYGRSEHAPIVIDMVDYGNDDYEDDYTYAGTSSHYSSPRHSNSMQSAPLLGGDQRGGMNQHSSRHASSTPRHNTGSRQASPHHLATPNIRQTSSSISHLAPRQMEATSPRQSVHMHNFAQRRSFMMGGFERPEGFQHQHSQDMESTTRVYRVETQEDDVIAYDGYPDDEGLVASEYRESPGRTRNFRQSDIRDRATPRSVSSVSRQGNPHHSGFGKQESSGAGFNHGQADNRFGNSYAEQSSAQHPVRVDDKQGATIPVFDRMKRPDEKIFTFDHTADSDVHTVPGIINRSTSPRTQDGNKDVAAPPSPEKKVFYFDIDDLSQRLLNSGDQDLSRRLRKKKAKNARSRISRNRARRKSKKSVFNLELDGSASGVLRGNDGTGATSPEPRGIGSDMSKGFGSRSFAAGENRSGLYVDTNQEVDEFAVNLKIPQRLVGISKEHRVNARIRRNPSAGLPPAEHQKVTLSPTATVEQDAEPLQDNAKARPTSPRDNMSVASRLDSPKSISPRHAPPENNDPRSREESAHDDRSIGQKSVSPNQPGRVSTSLSSPSPSGSMASESPRKIKAPENPEGRITQVYDDISDRLDHIVKRENDVENRQKAIRAVFEEVQQHVADLRKQKNQGKSGSSDLHDQIVDLVSLNEKQKGNVADEGDDQVLKRPNESSDVEDAKSRVRSPTIEDMVSKPIAPFAPPSPKTVPGPVSYNAPKPLATNNPAGQGNQKAEQIFDVDRAISKDGSVANHDSQESRAKKEPSSNDQDVLVIDLDEKADQRPEAERAKNELKNARSSGYLSSDNSCDDEVVVQNHSADSEKPNGVVYVIEEDDGKSVVHVEDKSKHEAKSQPLSPAQSEQSRELVSNEASKSGSTASPKAQEVPQVQSITSGIVSVKSIESQAADETCNLSKDGNDHQNGDASENESIKSIKIDPKRSKDSTSRNEQKATSKDASKEKDESENSEDGDDGDDGSLVGLASKTMEEAKKRDGIEQGVLDDSDSDDGGEVDIDAEFDRVVTQGKDDAANVSYNIDETLDRVARQKELDEKEEEEKKKNGGKLKVDKTPKKGEAESKPIEADNKPAHQVSRKDEDNMANALLDTFSNGSLFAGVDDTPSEMGNLPASPSADSNQDANTDLAKFVDIDNEDEDHNVFEEKRSVQQKSPISETEPVSLEYNFNLAISAGTKSGSSASDLQEFPLTVDQNADDEDEDEDDDDEDDDDEEEDDEDHYSGSSNVSSDISESTSGSETDSSYDSFISIVETEDESDLEYYDQEGFAENFMSNLVSRTFGWIEKKQEQLVCGFKSGDFEGPSLLRQSMTRQKKAEQDAAQESRNNKAMKSLRNAVATKYAKESPPAALATAASAVVAGDPKAKRSSRRPDAEPTKERSKKSKRRDSKKASSAERERRGQEPPSKVVEKTMKKDPESSSRPEKARQDVDDSRGRSDNRKGSDSDLSAKLAAKNDKRRSSSSKKVAQDEATVATARTTATARTSTSKQSVTSKTTSRSQPISMSPKPIVTPSTGAKIASQYNFDFLSSEDEDNAEGSVSSVQVIAVMPSVPEVRDAEKDARRAAKAKMISDAKKAQSPASTQRPVEVEPELVHQLDDALDTAEPVKSKSKRTSSKHSGSKTRSKSSAAVPPVETVAPKTETIESPAEVWESRDRSPSKTSNLPEDRDAPVGTVAAADKSSKKSSTSKSAKASSSSKKESKKKSSSKKEKSDKDSASKPSSRSSRRRATTDVKGRAMTPTMEKDESDSDGDSVMMTEEEREQARKDRRRAAALKRRRKLRERRRAKLEQNLTDDTFG